MDHRYWITVDLKRDVPDGLIYELINDSYELVVAKLPKKDREAFQAVPA